MSTKPSDQHQNELWKPPFMVDGGWILTRPHEAAEILSALADATHGSVRVAGSLKDAIGRSEYDKIRELQQQFLWPGRPQTVPSPEEVVRISRSVVERTASAYSPRDQELENELRSYSEFSRGPPRPVDRLLAEEFLFMKSSSTLLARTQRAFLMLRDRGKAILDLTRASLQRKREFMARFPTVRFIAGGVRFFAGSVVFVSAALAVTMAPLAIAGGAILWYCDP